jgi:hypothetical protein
MTRIGYVKPTDVSYAHEAVTTITRYLDESGYLLFSYRLQPTSRYLTDTLTGGTSPAPSQVWSLSAPSSLDVTNTIPAVSLFAHRFSQPLGNDNVRNDLQAYSILLALLGS